MPFAAVNGVSLYYELHGASGGPLIFIHGFTGDHGDWHHQVPELSLDHRVLTMDVRGHGRSLGPADRSQYTVSIMVRDAQELAEHLGLDRYHLVGHSMGGAIAQELALERSHQVLSLTLVDAARTYRERANDGPPPEPDWRRHLAETEGMAAVARAEAALEPPSAVPAHRTGEPGGRIARMSLDAYIGAMDGLERWEGTETRVAGITAPTLVVYGTKDVEVLVDEAMAMAYLVPNATLAPVPGAEHSPQWEQPRLFNDALRRFLKGLRSSS